MTLSWTMCATSGSACLQVWLVEVLEVDEFVDEVEETFAQLFEENQNLKKQVDSLKSIHSFPGTELLSAVILIQQPRPAPAPSAAPQASGSGPIVVTTGKDASTAVVRLVEMSTEQAERLVNEATEDANRSARKPTGSLTAHDRRAYESERRVRRA